MRSIDTTKVESAPRASELTSLAEVGRSWLGANSVGDFTGCRPAPAGAPMPKVKTECPRQTLRPDGGKTGDGSAPRSLSRTGIRRALTGLPASRRCSPRQAESPASQQGRPAPCGHWISSEAFQLAWAGGCATGPQTRSRHDCVCGPRLDHLARGLPPLLAVRSPRATGLASSLSGCVWLTGQRCRL